MGREKSVVSEAQEREFPKDGNDPEGLMLQET